MLRIGLLIFALAAGGGAAWVALQMSRDPVADKAALQRQVTAMQDVLVAATDLGVGRALNKENMRWVSIPESTLGPGDIVRSARPDALDSLNNWLVRSRIGAGEPIRDAKLIPAYGSILATLLPPGKRAVAVRISADNTAGGFILPGDRVDVLVTVGQEKSQLFTRTIPSNVLVRAIDQSVDDSSKDDKNKGKAGLIGKTATLELDPSQVEILSTGEVQGKLSLALRSAAENDEGPSDVMVASANLRPGQRLTKENMRWQSRPESALNRANINRSARPGALETLAGAIVRSPMTSGEAIRDENLAQRRRRATPVFSPQSSSRASAPSPCRFRRKTPPAFSSCRTTAWTLSSRRIRRKRHKRPRLARWRFPRPG